MMRRYSYLSNSSRGKLSPNHDVQSSAAPEQVAEFLQPLSGSRIVARFDGPTSKLVEQLAARCAAPVDVLADSVGDWAIDCLWRRGHPVAGSLQSLKDIGLPSLADLIEKQFRLDDLQYIRLFTTQSCGFVRPHRDWQPEAPKFSRYHMPVITHQGCANSEGSTLYRMAPGEIWYLDGSKPHSGICTARSKRVHVVLDFDPQSNILAPLRQPRPEDHRQALSKREGRLGLEQLAAIQQLSELITSRNLLHVLDTLGALHFDYEASSDAVYEWLDDIAVAANDRKVCSRAAALRRSYLG